MHVGIDVDGVLRKLMESLRREFLSDYPRFEDEIVSAEDLEYWDIRKLAPNSEDKLGRWLEVYCLENPETAFRCFRNADTFSGEVEAMGRLYHDAKFNDHIVSICTSQYHPWQKEATTEWLHEYNVPFDNTIMTSTGKGHFGLDMIFDDRVKNCEAVEQSGGIGVVRERQYNKKGRERLSESASSIDGFRKIMLRHS